MRVLGFTVETSFKLKIRWAKPQEKIVYMVREKKIMPPSNSKKNPMPSVRSFRTPIDGDQKINLNGKLVGVPIANDKEMVSLYQAGFTQEQIAEKMGVNQSTVLRRLKVYEQKPEK